MKRVCLLMVCAVIVAGFTAGEAFALPAFKKAFEAKYGGNEAIAAGLKTQSCNACHVKGEKKDVRNAYGKVLAEAIPGDAGARIKAAGEQGDDAKAAETEKVNKELMEAFKKAEAAKAADGVTYGERIKAGKMPVE